MIKELELKNFRGHKALKIENMSPITIITGTNNVGKSSILEALFLLHAHTSANVFSTLSLLRGGMAEPMIKSWEALFYRLDTSEEMKIGVDRSRVGRETLTFKSNNNVVPVTQLDHDFSQNSAQGSALNQFQIQQTYTSKGPYILEFDFERNDYKEQGQYGMNAMGMFANIHTSLPNDERVTLPWTYYMNSSIPRIANDIMEWVGFLEINNKSDMLLDVIKMIAPDTQSIFSATQNGQLQLYIKNDKGVIPLRYSGDGVVRLFHIMTAIMANRDGLILIDEIENGFHHNMYEKMWEMISKVAKQSNCQVIATSHSYEQIIGSLEGVEKSKRTKDYSLHRIERMGEKTIDKYYDYETALAAARNRLEIR